MSSMPTDDPVVSTGLTPGVHLELPLAYQQRLVTELLDDDALVILARGLALPRIVTNLIHAYNVAGRNLVVTIGATERDIEWMGAGLGELETVERRHGGGNPEAKGLTVVKTELVTVDKRELMYASGGAFVITSRILVVDMLAGIIPIDKITGIVVLHAERVSATSQEAFILRLFRQKNKSGFIKAFSDMPENFASGFSPLTNMMKHLFLRKASLWPRFQVLVAESLEVGTATRKRRKDVIEIAVSLSPAMREIQTALLECIEACTRELRRATASLLDLDDDEWAVETALSATFQQRIMRQLDPVFHRLSGRTKQIISDIGTLRQLLSAILNADCVTFLKYLDTVMSTNMPAPGRTKQNSSPWLFLDAANVVFLAARHRVYTGSMTAVPPNSSRRKENEGFPEGVRPVLEEQPKWEQLGLILDEITAELFANPHASVGGGDSTVLVMCHEETTCKQIKEYLVERGRNQNGDEDADSRNSGARPMLRGKLYDYVFWKHDLGKHRDTQQPLRSTKDSRLDDALRGRAAPPNKRRRTRGGSATASSGSSATAAAAAARRRAQVSAGVAVDIEEDAVVQVLADALTNKPDVASATVTPLLALDDDDEPIFDDRERYYGLFDMNDMISVQPYDGDMDDYILDELAPRYIIMYEPDPAFVRRIEVYRASNRERELKVYFMYYAESVEEQHYLSAVRKEKDAFSKLIRERGNMAMILSTDTDDLASPEDSFLRKINTRIAGGSRSATTITTSPPRVIVDMREFRSSLPSLLHARQMVVVPAMLIVGDYILSPDICVERKSVPDLIASFADGRLYTQCESMTKYYKTIVLLIEFAHNKSFALEEYVSGTSLSSATTTTLQTETNNSTSTNTNNNRTAAADVTEAQATETARIRNDLHACLVLLVLAFPHLRIVWSSSPFQTAEIFLELKLNHPEPDPEVAAGYGTDADLLNVEDGENVSGGDLCNQAGVDMLRAMPGITEVNYRNVMYDVENFQQLCELQQEEIAKSIGDEAAGKVYRFINRNVRK
ncbi:uncharacterized protein V1518DRAFT_416320 [Limtongia smithiae]|uniref:uncharacterized protein n=1 Tax=Limtongia smithiae TaxID=1125753 RepID=UPI0034CDFA5A